MSPSLISLLLLIGQPVPDANTGGVAVVVNMPDNQADLREVAVGILEGARKQWGLLTPPIKVAEVDACGAVDVCLNNLAKSRGASHLFIVGLASIDEGEAVVSLQMYDSLGAELITYSDVLDTRVNPRAAGEALFVAQTAELTEIPGPEDVTEQWPAPPEPEVASYHGLGAFSITGLGLIGLGGVAAAAALAFGTLQTLYLFSLQFEQNVSAALGCRRRAVPGCELRVESQHSRCSVADDRDCQRTISIPSQQRSFELSRFTDLQFTELDQHVADPNSSLLGRPARLRPGHEHSDVSRGSVVSAQVGRDLRHL